MCESSNAAATQVVLGAPIFGNSPQLTIKAPIGQLHLNQLVRRETNDPAEVFQVLCREYMAVAFVLRAMGVNFKILMPESPLIHGPLRQAIIDEGFDIAPFPATKDMSALLFPRDLATRLPNGTTLLDNSLHREAWINQVRPHVTLSEYGQGGRLLVSERVAFVNEEWYFDHDPRQVMQPRTQPLEQANLRIGLLPNAAMVETNGRQTAYGCDDHTDRTVGQIVDDQGRVHLVVDPKIRSGFMGLTSRPRWAPKYTLQRYQVICDKIGVELHVPNKLTVPASVGFLQLPSGQVLVTKGDDEIASIASDIVGASNVFITPVPIRYFPAWNKASIRCLIGEWPNFLCNLAT